MGFDPVVTLTPMEALPREPSRLPPVSSLFDSVGAALFEAMTAHTGPDVIPDVAPRMVSPSMSTADVTAAPAMPSVALCVPTAAFWMTVALVASNVGYP